MPQIVYRANLASAQFPFSGGAEHGQTVIVGGSDQNFSRQLAARADQDRSVGIPQVFTVRDVLPVEQGYASVATTPSNNLPSFNLSDTGARKIFVRGTDYYLYAPSTANTFALHRGAQGTSVTSALAGTYTSLYVLNGVLYAAAFLSPGITLNTLNGVTLTPQVLIGAPAAATLIDATSCFGYNILITATTFYWSSLTNPLDFTPSLITGAGNFSIQQAQGNLIALIPAANGVYVVCEQNIVFMRYTGNSRFPFAAQVVENSAPPPQVITGLGSTNVAPRKMAISNPFVPQDEKYAITPTGVHILTPRALVKTLPEAAFLTSDGTFFQRNIITAIPGDTGLRSVRLGGVLAVEFVGSRYVCLIAEQSITSPTQFWPVVFVYDTYLQRWGQFFDVNYVTEDVRGKTVTGGGFSTRYSTASPDVVVATNPAIARASMLCLGRYQHVRGRMLELHSVDIQGGGTRVFALASLKGDNVTTTHTPSAIEYSSRQTRYFFNNVVGLNVSLLMEGPFNVTSAVLNFGVHGKAMFS